MSRTAGLIVLFLAVLLLTVRVNGAPSDENTECCPCPGSGQKTGESAPSPDMEEAPETMELDMKGEIYGPVEFTHLEHTDYADDGCTQCHHHQSPAGPFKSCGDCHKRKPFQGADKLNIPGLKGAYHRQCVGCHVDYGSGPTECVECHEEKAPEPSGK